MRPAGWIPGLVLAFVLAFPQLALGQSYTYAATTFSWESSGSYTDVTWSNLKECTSGAAAVDDDITAELPLGFTFRFGAVDYTTVRIQSNGRLQFNNNFCGFGTQTVGPPPTYPYGYPDGLPGGSAANVSRTLRVYGGDLDPSIGGKVRYQSTGMAPNRRFVVIWDSVPEYNAKGSKFEIQIILHENGEFVYQYKTFDNTSKGQGQVGWMLSSTDYALVPYASIGAGKAFLFRPTAAGSVAGYTVSTGASSASTCSPKQITITALDGTGAILTNYTGTIILSTSANRGDWAIAGAVGTLANGTANDGAATYTFVAGDKGVATLLLSNSHADDLTVSVVDATTASAKATSSTINFRDNAYVLSLDTVQVAGRPQSIGVAMWRRDPTTGNCSIATNYTGTKALDAWLTRDVQDPGGAAPTIGGVSLPSSAPATNAGSNNVSLAFSAGQATLTLATSDVGKYVLNLRDDTRSFASGVDISGATAAITTRPFALGFSEIKQGGGTCSPASGTATCNPGGTATAGSKFVAAGDAFQATVGGYLWSAADDANNDGVPDAGANVTDNGLAPSFAWTTTLSATTPITPVAGVTGALVGTTVLAPAAYAGGRATASALTYAEVGSVTLQATSTSYLGTAGADLSGTSGVVGRFFPGRFAVLGGSSVTPACVAGSYTYMGQSALSVAAVVEAQTTAGDRTFNYAAPGYATGTVAWHGENADSGSDLSGRLVLPTVSWSAGRYVLATTSASFQRAGAPDGPYDSLQLGVSVSDRDGAVLTGRNMNPAATGDCAAAGNCTAVAFGSPTKVRFGRLRVQSASGSELLPLTVPIEAQYWNGSGFTRHTSDVCTVLPAGAIALGTYTQRSAAVLSPAPTTLSVPGGPLSAGAKLLTLSAPGVGKGGDAEVVVNLGSSAAENLCGADTFASSGSNLAWLRGRWCGVGHDRDPVGRVTFGVRRASNTLVFLRENY